MNDVDFLNKLKRHSNICFYWLMYITEFASIKSFKVYLFAHNSKFMITFL